MYVPTHSILEGIRNAFPQQLFPWDEYYARMAETDFLAGRSDIPAVKSFFIRTAPFGGSYALLGGITAALRDIAELQFSSDAFTAGMHDLGYSENFLRYLGAFGRLRVRIYAPPEGSVFFPNEPVVSVSGPLAHVRLVEGIILEALNFPSLVLTKWYRLVRSVRPGEVLEFSRRRAQHALKASLYGMLAGCHATSNAELRRYFDVPVVGTMGHEWVQSFGDVGAAFRVWLTHQPGKPVGLVDTLRCLEHDFPAWLDAVYERRAAIVAADAPLWGWRNDSGDLAYLTIEQYVRFFRHALSRHDWFRERMRIVLTNELDEYAATSIVGQIRTEAGQAGLDAEDIIRRIVWAAGTKPGTCEDQSSLGGVMKLVEVEGRASMKPALDAEGRVGIKTSIPGFNRSAIIRDERDEFRCLLLYPARRYEIDASGTLVDVLRHQALKSLTLCHKDTLGLSTDIAEYRAEAQQELVYDSLNGGGLMGPSGAGSIQDVVSRVRKEVDELPWWMTRLSNPHLAQVSVTPDIVTLRRRMIETRALVSEYNPF